MYLSNRDVALFENMLKLISAEGDPVLVLVWNQLWEAIHPLGNNYCIYFK